MKDCIFCKIIRKEIHAEIIYEDSNVVAFLDAFPCVEGQMLVIPKKHIGYFIDLDDKTYSHLMLVVKKIAKAMHKTFNPIKVGIIIEGLEVEHVHVKLFPLGNKGFKDIIHCKPKFSEKNMKEIADEVKKALN
jgi:histidine triad (HIT) family protein